MKMRKMRYIFMVAIMIAVLSGCTLPGFSTPTPFIFPTPDKTMTALFEPTQAVPATSASNEDPLDSPGTESTATAKVVPTNTPKDGPTDIPDTKTPPPPAPTKTAISYAGPAVRSGPTVVAEKRISPIVIDGSVAEWTAPWQKVIKYVVFGAGNWTDTDDCSGIIKAAWDEDYLYLNVKVKDDMYVQEAEKEKLYLGDSIEIVFDRYVSGDYYLQAMTGDDYQIGISPGRYGIAGMVGGKVAAVVGTEPPMAYMWAPKASAGVKNTIKIGAVTVPSGYQVEFKIPWSLIGVSNPSVGDHYGFAVSISDNDSAGKLLQQSMVSNVSTRYYADPTSWGDLYLK
jgi:hypothetical protein